MQIPKQICDISALFNFAAQIQARLISFSFVGNQQLILQVI